jgi:parallel beta-helix repeat protein
MMGTLTASSKQVYINGGGGNSVTNNTFVTLQGGATGISLNATSQNTITGNRMNGSSATVGIILASSSNNTIQGNSIYGTMTTGISLDATSNNNPYTNMNTVAAGVTTPISDSGTGNSAAPTWGTITGTLSSQTDLNTALGLKAPLASPALTGTPTVPTAAPGTNTTQAASTAFVQAAVTGGTLPPQAADTVVMNATGSSAVPSAVAMPTCTTGADLYNTTTHTWSCVGTGGAGGNGLFTYTTPILGNFTWVNQGSCTATANANTTFMKCPTNGAADNNRAMVENVPSSPYSIVMWFSADMQQSNYLQKGLTLYDGTKLLNFSIQNNTNLCNPTSSTVHWGLGVDLWTNVTTYGSSLALMCIQPVPWLGLRIDVVSGGNDTYYYSKDGVNWIQFFQEADHTHITQTKVGYYMNPNSQLTTGTGVPSGGFGMDMTIASWTD